MFTPDNIAQAAPLAVLTYTFPKGDFFEKIRKQNTNSEFQAQLSAKWEESSFYSHMVDPLVLPYLSRFCQILLDCDFSIPQKLMHFLNAEYRFRQDDITAYVQEIAIRILTKLVGASNKQGSFATSNDARVFLMGLANDQEWHRRNTDIVDLLKGPLEQWRMSVVNTYLLASTVANFKQCCQLSFENYQKLVHKFLSGECQQLEAFALNIEDAPELRLDSATKDRFRINAALIRLAYERKHQTTCPYTVHASLQYAVEQHVINDLSFSFILAKALENQDPRAHFALRNRLIEEHGFDLHSSDVLFQNRTSNLTSIGNGVHVF